MFSTPVFNFVQKVEASGGNDEKVDQLKGSFISIVLEEVLLSNKE